MATITSKFRDFSYFYLTYLESNKKLLIFHSDFGIGCLEGGDGEPPHHLTYHTSTSLECVPIWHPPCHFPFTWGKVFHTESEDVDGNRVKIQLFIFMEK